MKKILYLIILLVIIFSCTGYQMYIKKGNEEIEVLNTDVSINNIKSIVNIEDQIDDNYEEVPLGYINGNIYLIKYDYDNKRLYDNNIFILNKDGSTKECGITLPEYYSGSELSILGDKIFGKEGYFNWQSGKEYKLVSHENNELTTNWYSVSGNSDYYLCTKNSAQNKKYILYNINSNDEYNFECRFDSEDIINGIFYDDISKKFYAVCPNNVVKELAFSGTEFVLEKYDGIKINNKDNDSKNKEFMNNYLNYTYCLEGQAYLGLGYSDKSQDSININQYDIADKFTEQLNNITLYGYDSFHKEYILIKKDDDKSSNKIYLAKLEKNGFDMLIEIPKIYSDDSKLSIHMIDSENVLVKEENHDKENKKIKNRYIVYNLAQYFQENTIKSKNDSDKLTLKNTYKNINEFNDYDSNNKNKVNEENKNIQEVEEPKPIFTDNTTKENNINTNASAVEKDYRENDSSWKKGNGEWYYYKDNDEKVIGWLKTEKGWYYFYKDGTMQRDVTVIGKKGKEYKIGHDGLLINPDSDLNYNYDDSKEKSNKENKNSNSNSNDNNGSSNSNSNTSINSSNNAKDNHNINENSNISNETKEKQDSKDNKNESNIKK